MDLNGFRRSGPAGPTVQSLSGLVSGIGPQRNSRTKNGPTYPPPPKGAVGGGGPLQIIHCNTDETIPEKPPESEPEPTDEELWLEETARQVEADARPVFALALAYLFQRALDLDENEPPT